MSETLIQTPMRSPCGEIFLVTSPKGLKRLSFRREPGVKMGRNAVAEQTVKQLKRYFSGQAVSFTVPLDMDGTAFQKKVWAELCKIPYGETRSYRDIAKRIRNPRAVRAVGSANGKNPICIVVPCHRVIAADGSIGGYTGGLDLKRQLLKIEMKREFGKK